MRSAHTVRIDRQKEFVGILKSYDENTVTITYEDETEQTFDRKEIALIRQALDFNLGGKKNEHRITRSIGYS